MRMDIIPFEYESNEIRVIQDDHDDLWWVVSDICEILGLSNASEAIRGLDDDEKSTLRISEGGPERNIINEAGLYSLIIRSNKPDAKKFKRWITHEVLPSIRKTGKYEIEGLSEIDLIIRSAQSLKKMESKLIEHENRFAMLEALSHQNSGRTGFFTISAWCKFNRINISLSDAMNRGREATRLSKEWGVDVGRVTDERIGVVNSYREDVLEEVFECTVEI